MKPFVFEYFWADRPRVQGNLSWFLDSCWGFKVEVLAGGPGPVPVQWTVEHIPPLGSDGALPSHQSNGSGGALPSHQSNGSGGALPSQTSSQDRRSGGTLRLLSVLTFLATLTITTGCANWNANNEPGSSKLNLNNSRMSPGSVEIEIAVAQLDSDQADDLEQLLGTIDQQKLSLDIRQQLDRNGLACGIMSSRPPATFYELLEPFVPDPETLDIAARPLALAGLLDPVSRLLLHQRISNQNGDVYPVGTSDLYDHIEWTVVHPNHQVAGEANLARAFFDLTTYPNSDGSVTLKLSPVIRHGEKIQQISVADGSFVMDRGQRQIRLDEVGFSIQLRAGQTLVVAADKPFLDHSSENAPLGKMLLGSENANETRLLLVRLVQTQMDDLFNYSTQ
jgi:hypothetical protein